MSNELRMHCGIHEVIGQPHQKKRHTCAVRIRLSLTICSAGTFSLADFILNRICRFSNEIASCVSECKPTIATGILVWKRVKLRHVIQTTDQGTPMYLRSVLANFVPVDKAQSHSTLKGSRYHIWKGNESSYWVWHFTYSNGNQHISDTLCFFTKKYNMCEGEGEERMEMETTRIFLKIS